MRGVALILAVVLMSTAVAAQQPARQPARTTSGSLGMYVFPAKGQSAEMQQMDEAACYAWARENTGFDPIAVASAATQPSQQQAPKGVAAKSAGRGAAAGAAIGAVAGDAGQGAAIGATSGALRGRMAKKMAERRGEQAEAQAEKQLATKMEGFRKAFGVCMEAKGYTVK